MGFWSDVGNVAAAGASTVGNAVEQGSDAIIDTTEDVVATVGDGIAAVPDAVNDAAAATGNPVVAGIGAVGAGIAKGFLNFARDVGHSAASVFRDVAGALGALFRGDFGSAFTRFVESILDVGNFALAFGRLITGGYFVGAIETYRKRNYLRAFVEELLADTFGGDASRLGMIRSHVGLTGVKWGLPMQATHNRFMLDSATMDAGPTPLHQLHRDGFIDLYALAGLWSSDQMRNSFRVWPHDTPTSVVYLVNPDGSDGMRADRLSLSNYINDSERRRGIRIRIYAMSRSAIAERLQVASDKVEGLGVILNWNDGERFSWMRGYASFEITNPADLYFDITARQAANGDIRVDAAGSWLIDKGLRSPPTSPALDRAATAEEGMPIAFAVFQYDAGHVTTYGFTAGRAIAEGSNSSPCATAGRTDGCCSRIAHMTVPKQPDPLPPPAPPPAHIPATPLGSGVFHRDFWPNIGARYILAHEMGHYLGLCHFGHDSVDLIMFSPKSKFGPKWFFPGVLTYWAWSEPRFTLEDGKNAWRFLVNQMPHVLEGA